MTDESETRLDNPTEVMRGVDQLQGLEARAVAPMQAAEPAPYVKEPLFSKRVMITWALATLVAWFGLTVVVPAIVQSVAEAVKQSVVAGPAGTTRIETKRGTITITKDADGRITVERTEPGSGTAAPVPGPAVPAQPATPAEPGSLPEVSGKK